MGTNAGDIQEIVSLGRRMPPVDTGISESGLIINSEALLELPVNRDLTAVALLAPGTTRGDGRFGNLASFGGASIAENTSFINGLNTTNFRTGVGFSKVPFEFYETLQIKTGGYSAQYGRSTGGVMNAVTKSGSNDWDMGVNVYYNDAIATSPNILSPLQTTSIRKLQRLPIFMPQVLLFLTDCSSMRCTQMTHRSSALQVSNLDVIMISKLMKVSGVLN